MKGYDGADDFFFFFFLVHEAITCGFHVEPKARPNILPRRGKLQPHAEWLFGSLVPPLLNRYGSDLGFSTFN